MFQLALTSLEKAINAVLQLDPETMQRLDQLEGKVIAIDITDWQMKLFITGDHYGLQLLTQAPSEPCTIIRGKLFNLCRVGKAGGSGNAMFDNAVEISGDMQLGETIRNIMQNIDIDWEEHLSRITGDTLAHKIGRTAHDLKSFFCTAKQSLQRNLSEYLHNETQILPKKGDIENFYTDIAALRNAVDRSAVKLQHLETNLGQE